MQFEIQEMTEATLPGRAYVHCRSWQETYRGLMPDALLDAQTQEKCEKVARRFPQNTLVAVSDGQVIGFACYGEQDGLPMIHALYVLKAHQKSGVGRALMLGCLSRLPRSDVRLHVLEGNSNAIGFYQHMGFRLTGKRFRQETPLGAFTELEMLREAPPPANDAAAFEYRLATLDDLPLLVETRMTVLRAANGLPADADLGAVASQTAAYYRRSLSDDAHVACLVFDGDAFVGAGGVSFYQVMPTCHNPTGWKAYIMNMYTAPGYRRRGVARRTLELLVRESLRRGISFISLEATANGRPLYEKFGFRPMDDEMRFLSE